MLLTRWKASAVGIQTRMDDRYLDSPAAARSAPVVRVPLICDRPVIADQRRHRPQVPFRATFRITMEAA